LGRDKGYTNVTIKIISKIILKIANYPKRKEQNCFWEEIKVIQMLP